MDMKTDNNLEDVQYFLARISEFEELYKMESWHFHTLYENSRAELEGYSGMSAVDYSEWAFLYENFQSLMNRPLYESPPDAIHDTDHQRPESHSGLCFIGGKRDQFGAGISCPRRNASLCQNQRTRYSGNEGAALDASRN